jgi:hypothetical protein
MYNIERYSRAIYEIVSASSQQRWTIFLDFANEDHYRCISEMFGGEDRFKKDFPAHNLLAQKTRQEHAANRAMAAESNLQGFENYAEVQDVFYKKSDKKLYSCGYVNLVGESDVIYQNLLVYRNGKQIDANSSFYYDSSFAFIDLTTNNVESLGGQNDDLTIVIHSSVKPKGKDNLLSAISYDTKDSLNSTLDEVVKNIDVRDPRHINTAPDKDIVVAYGRTPSSGESIDYSYPDARLEQLQKVFLANSGTVELQDGVKFIEGDAAGTSIVLNHELGTIWYSNTPGKASTIDDTHFSWSIDKDWKNVIPSSIAAGTRTYAYDMHLSFLALRPGDAHPKQFYINVCSYQKSPNPHYKQISYIRLLWGCLGEDSRVKMADGSLKTIQTVAIGDRVMGLDGRSLNVTNVWTGTEENILRLIVKNGDEIMATEDHPFMTREGMKPLLKLSIGDELLMKNGSYSAIAQCYPVSYGRSVYNLDVDGDGAFICNGFVVGDNRIQNSYQIPANEAATPQPFLDEAEKLRSIYSKLK